MADKGYVTWDDDKGRAKAFAEVSEGVRITQPVLRTQGSNLYFNIAPHNTSVRDSFRRSDYEEFRLEERLPSKPKEYIAACMDAYDRVSIIRNIIDLMADFAVKGIDLSHPNERIEKFYKEWFRRVSAVERSERFLNIFYRCGNVISARQTAKLTVKQEERIRRSKADPDIKIEDPPAALKREIPWRYHFLNPLTVELLSEELATLVGPEGFIFGVRIPRSVAMRISDPRTATDRALVSKLPAYIKEAVKKGDSIVPLDPAKISVHYYKRDDWCPWAKPLASAVLADLHMLQKMKLADLAALDGAISSIRVWKLGSLENKILPSPAMMQRLAEMLNNNVGGGVMDLVWGPDIELTETKTDIHQFLGATKYAPTLDSIFQGLGIPPTLAGASETGFTNNYISLKTLTERLEYGRQALRAFWEEEIRLVQKAMDFRFPAVVTFDSLLTDEAAEKNLLLSMWDRDLISDEAIRERFGLTPEIESLRVRREYRKRQEGKNPPKASNFHDPMVMEGLAKIFAGSGAYAPSEFGVELQERKKDEKTPGDDKVRLKETSGPKGEAGQGRPLLSKDSKKRKRKTVKPRTSAQFVNVLAWAENSLNAIAKLTGPAFLKSVGKKNMRELTEEETKNYEAFKFALLCQVHRGQEVNEQLIASLIKSPLLIPSPISQLLKATIERWVTDNGREPPLEVLRRFQSSVYALYAGEF